MAQAQPIEETRKLAAPSVPDAISTHAVVGLWSSHLLCFVVPLTTLAFALSGPHSWFAALPFLGAVAASVIIDRNAHAAYDQPARSLPGWPFNSVLYVLTALQLANVVLVVSMLSRTTLWSADAFVAVVLLGVSSGYSGIVVAHELMHRREKRFHSLDSIRERVASSGFTVLYAEGRSPGR